MIEVFLFVCVSSASASNPAPVCMKHKMPNVIACTKSVESMKILRQPPVKSDEPAVFAFCAGDNVWRVPADYK